MLQVDTLSVGPIDANCHIVSDTEGNAVLIDPGDEADRILAFLEEKGMHPLAILLTHGHFDHFCASAQIQEKYSIPVYIHPLDEPMLHSPLESLAVSLGYAEHYHESQEIKHFDEGDTLSFSDALTFTVLHTPGHSPGGCCFLHDRQLFTGDTLFRDGVGRIDFKGGDIHAMRRSLARLGALEGDYTVYCGHFANTTIERERRMSPYLIPRKL